MPIRRLVTLAVATLVAAAGAAMTVAPAQGATVWRMQAVPPGPNANLWMDAPGAVPALGRNIGSGVHPPTQWWSFRRVGGTIQFPWYELVNAGSGQCVYYGGVTGAEGTAPHPAEMRGCSTDFRLYWFQFRTLTNQPVNPGLSAGAPRVYRIHWMGQGDEPIGTHCLVVPNSFFQPGTRLAVQSCSGSPNQQWRLYRTTR
jgi:hypothetical protein